MFKRLIKSITALGAGHGIQTLAQLLIPPAFIAAYGVQGYGEWLALSAAVGYLSTLDFGLQTYVLNELTTLYHRNDLEGFHRVQSVGLRLTLGFVVIGTVVASAAFFLPIPELLKLSNSYTGAGWAVFWLALQILASIPLGQILGLYRTLGQAHRGVMWSNFHRILLLAVTVGLAFLRASFWVVAFGQFLVVLLVLVVAVFWLRASRPDVCPRVGYWDGKLAKKILKPSGFFGLFILNNFLVFQAPVVILQRFVGPEAVVVFSVARTVFSFARQGIGLLQQAVYPELGRLNVAGPRDGFVRLYVLFEAAVLTAVLIINTGLLLLSPMVVWLWLKKPQLFNLQTFTFVMLASAITSVKDFKMNFQSATNNHEKASVATLFSYALMILVSLPAIQWFGMTGFLITWIGVESLQLLIVHSYNIQLFNRRREISMRPTSRLGLVLGALVVLVGSGRSLLQSNDYLWQGIVAVSVMAIAAAVSYFAFNLREVVQESRAQFTRIFSG